MDKLTVKASIKRDSDGFENIDEFWESAEPVVPTPVKNVNDVLTKIGGVSEYDTSDEISDEEEISDNSTRFSYDTNQTIDMSMNTTVMEEDYDTDENVEGDGIQSVNTSKSSNDTNNSRNKSNVSSRRNSTKSVDSNVGGDDYDDANDDDDAGIDLDDNANANTSGATPISVMKSGGNSVTGSRRVSFGSPILHDQANTPYSTISSGNNSLASSGRRSSAGMSMDRSAASTPAISSSSRRSSVSSTRSGSDLESSMMTNLTTISTPGSMEFPRGRVLADETFVQHGDGDGDDDDNGAGSEDDSEEEATMDDSGFTTDDSLLRSAAKRTYREDSDEDEDHSVDSEEERHGPCRRSRRATKGQKFQFWKNERAVYERGSMIGFLQAEPTPKKPKRATVKCKGNGKRGGVTSKQLQFKEEPPLVPVKLPAGVNYLDRDKVEEMTVWDEAEKAVVDSGVICLNERVKPMMLRPAKNRPNSKKHLVGTAAQSFNVKETDFMSAWISGFVELPPHGIKDPEGVGDCSQVFFVSDCQDGALEFAMGDPQNANDWDDEKAQRLLLKSRDTFYVPPGNIYRLENHSSTKPCVIYWTIIKALSTYEPPLEEEEEEDISTTAATNKGVIAATAAKVH